MSGWLYTILAGGLVGWLASRVTKAGRRTGLLADIAVGMVGSALGFWLAGLLGFDAYGLIAQLAIAVLGASLLVYVLRALRVP